MNVLQLHVTHLTVSTDTTLYLSRTNELTHPYNTSLQRPLNVLPVTTLDKFTIPTPLVGNPLGASQTSPGGHLGEGAATSAGSGVMNADGTVSGGDGHNSLGNDGRRIRINNTHPTIEP